MIVIGGVLLFVAGVATGGSAVWYNRRSIDGAVKPVRKENERLKTCAWEDRLEYETERAYRKGYNAGRKDPMTDVERFADTLDKNDVTFRMERRRRNPS